MMTQLVAFKCWLENFILLVGLLGLMVLGWLVMVRLVQDTLELFKRWFRR